MKLFHTISDIKEALQALRSEGKTIGFVPTMGALHKGHLTLMEKCLQENDICVVSVFVNPTQFNDKEDFRKYPRTLERDCDLLEKTGVSIVFAPSEQEMYPEPDNRQFDFGMLDKVMEGKFRPGHFNGVVQVVSKLFCIVAPDKAYFGEKDFQQLAIIRQMVKDLDMPIKIVGVPIVREESGLAMSSRNERLTEEQRKKAAIVYAILSDSKESISKFTVKETIQHVVSSVNKENGLQVEYFEIVDGDTLQPVSSWEDWDYIVGCITVFCGDVRLIDNITYRKREK